MLTRRNITLNIKSNRQQAFYKHVNLLPPDLHRFYLNTRSKALSKIMLTNLVQKTLRSKRFPPYLLAEKEKGY